MVWCVANHEIVKRPVEKKIWSIQKDKKTTLFPYLTYLDCQLLWKSTDHCHT